LLLSLNEDNLIEILKGNSITPETPSLLVAYIKRFSVVNVSLARTATLLLWKFSNTEENRQQIVRVHGITVLVKLIYRYYNTDVDITLKGFRAIFAILAERLFCC
jgi:hypothetical protein